MSLHKRKQKNPFILIEKRLLDAPEWILIGKVGRDLYLELKRNFNGYNNGNLICAYTFMRNKYRYGYKTISKGLKALQEHQFIEMIERGELEGLSGKKANKYRLIGKHERIREGS